MSHLVERYANLLSKDDVLELFQTLQQVYKGNVSKACRKCGIQRKTSYDWVRARSLKLSTKKKVLKTMLEVNPEGTLDSILARSKETTVELLSTYLSHMYAKTTVEGIDPRSFAKAVKKIEKIKNEHVGLIWELEEEVGEMMYHIRERASALKVSLPLESIETIRPSHLLEMVPAVVDAIARRRVGSVSEIATNLKVPKRLVQVMSEAIVIPFRGVQHIETTQSELPFSVDELLPTASVRYPVVWGRNPVGYEI